MLRLRGPPEGVREAYSFRRRCRWTCLAPVGTHEGAALCRTVLCGGRTLSTAGLRARPTRSGFGMI